MALTGPIDVPVIEQLANDLEDRDLVRTILGAYVEHFDSRRDAVAAAIADTNLAEVISAAHALASASVTIGVRAIFAPARAIEDQARHGDLSEAADLLAVIDEQAPSVVAALQAW